MTLHPPAHARWIGSDHPFDLHEVYLNLRTPSFVLPAQPASARLLITGDSRYKAWVNGVFVGRGPARSWPHAQQVDALDITPHLRAGRNIIAVQIYQPGYSHFAYLHRGAAGLLAWLECDGATVLVSDQRWRVRRDPSFSPHVERVSIYSSGVEDRDLALDDDWTAPSYDPAAWAAARIVAPAQSPLWSGLRLRATPMLREEVTYFSPEEGGDHPVPAPPVVPRLAAAAWVPALSRPQTPTARCGRPGARPIPSPPRQTTTAGLPPACPRTKPRSGSLIWVGAGSARAWPRWKAQSAGRDC